MDKAMLQELWFSFLDLPALEACGITAVPIFVLMLLLTRKLVFAIMFVCSFYGGLCLAMQLAENVEVSSEQIKSLLETNEVIAPKRKLKTSSLRYPLISKDLVLAQKIQKALSTKSKCVADRFMDDVLSVREKWVREYSSIEKMFDLISLGRYTNYSRNNGKGNDIGLGMMFAFMSADSLFKTFNYLNYVLSKIEKEVAENPSLCAAYQKPKQTQKAKKAQKR